MQGFINFPKLDTKIFDFYNKIGYHPPTIKNYYINYLNIINYEKNCFFSAYCFWSYYV